MTTMRDDGRDALPAAGELRVALGPESDHLGLEPLVVGPDDAPDAGIDGAVLLEAVTTASDGVRRLHVVVDGWRLELEVQSARRAALRARATRGRHDASSDGPLEVRAIIPGVVLSVGVAPGDEVEAGQQLLVVEAMKMQNEIRAPRAGRVARVAVAAGQTLEVRDPLVTLEPV